MPYLTLDEYKEMPFTVITDEKEFNKLNGVASDLLDQETSYFYNHYDFEKDFIFRKKQVKKFVACQISHMKDKGATTTSGVKSPKNISLGRFSMSTEETSSKEQTKLTSDDAIAYLVPTGLLYRGVIS